MGRPFWVCATLVALLALGCTGPSPATAPPAPGGTPAPAAPPPAAGGTPAPPATAPPAPCRVADPEPRPGYRVLHVFFTCAGLPVPVPRQVPETPAVLAAALRELLRGPSPEERAAGFHSFFSDQTAGALRSVTLAPDGSAVVDFTAAIRIPNASTSAGSAQLLAELQATVFQFPTVRQVQFRIEGSCDAFWHWLQRECQWLGPSG